MKTIKQVLLESATKFKEAKLESAYLDSRLLLAKVLDKPIEYLLSKESHQLTDAEISNFEELVARRAGFEPIAYILGYKEFYGREFAVNEHVLIPRPDTEILIDGVLKNIDPADKLEILDLGTGSGCIIITLLLEIAASRGNGKAYGVAIDISKAALKIATKNATNFGVEDRIEFIQSNWFEELPPQKFDIIVSNPPYIAQNDAKVAVETSLFEPRHALFASRQGLESYMEIAVRAKEFLKKDGKLFFEVGYNQAESVIQIFVNQNYIFQEIYKDLSGKDRIVCLTSL